MALPSYGSQLLPLVRSFDASARRETGIEIRPIGEARCKVVTVVLGEIDLRTAALDHADNATVQRAGSRRKQEAVADIERHVSVAE